MESARHADVERSPKRQARASVHDITTVSELDNAIWTSIIEFLPIPNDLQPRDTKNYAARVSEVTATWETLLSLRLVSRQLAALLHPREKTLWQRLLLHSFDFSSSGWFNLENFQEDLGLGDDEDEETGEEEEEKEENPLLLASRSWGDATPENYLEEDLKEWAAIGIFYRPSQYGFLTTLQQQQREGTWPETEDPFTLFRDIVRLLQMPHGDGMNDCGEAGDSMSKYLAAPTEKGVSSRYYQDYVMKTLGYVPHFWGWGRGIGGEWKGFTEPEAMEEMITKLVLDSSLDMIYDYEGLLDFPGCSIENTKLLFQHIRAHCRDWRSVCCNSGSDGETPVFFMGESKSKPHRWIGYVGQKTWT